jgi:hypothetical protein
LKDYQKKMHLDWWALLGIKNPCNEEKGSLEVDWAIRLNCDLQALQGESTLKHFEFCIWAFLF